MQEATREHAWGKSGCFVFSRLAGSLDGACGRKGNDKQHGGKKGSLKQKGEPKGGGGGNRWCLYLALLWVMHTWGCWRAGVEAAAAAEFSFFGREDTDGFLVPRRFGSYVCWRNARSAPPPSVSAPVSSSPSSAHGLRSLKKSAWTSAAVGRFVRSSCQQLIIMS